MKSARWLVLALVLLFTLAGGIAPRAFADTPETLLRADLPGASEDGRPDPAQRIPAPPSPTGRPDPAERIPAPPGGDDAGGDPGGPGGGGEGEGGDEGGGDLGNEVLPGIYRLDGTAPHAPFDDLAPLRRIVGDAWLVGLGEVVHTSGGFYEMKARVFRYLVEELGFRAFGFETAWEEAMRPGEYVATCAGSAEDATLGLYGVWQSQEVADLLRWMCEWNQRHPRDPVVFFGFDIQQAPQDREALIELFLSLGLASNDSRIVGLRSCSPAGFGTRPTPEQNAICLAALDALEAEYPALADGAGLAPRERAFGQLRFASLRAQITSLSLLDDHRRSLAARDAGMTQVLLGLRDLVAPGKRTAVWAHNVHLGKSRPLGFLTLGTHLDEVVGKGYVTFGLFAFHPHIDWPGRGCGDAAGDYLASSVEGRLHALDQGYLLVDLDFPGVAEPFFAPYSQYYLDWGLMVPRVHYDALLYFDVSRPMAPLFRAPCQ